MSRDYSKMTIQEGVQEGGVFITPEQAEYSKKQNQKTLSNERFIRLKGSYDEVKKHLTLEQNGVVLFMVSLMGYNSEGVLYHNREKVGIAKLAKLLGKSERTIRRIIQELERFSLVVREKEGNKTFLSLGETFFVCGYSEEKFWFVKLYKERLSELAQKVSLSELGLFMLLSSHFHYKTHLLVDNPSEKEASKLVLWTRKHIAEEFNVSRDFVKKAVQKLQKVRAIFEIKTVTKGLVLDPKLVSRIEGKQDTSEILDTIEKSELSKQNVKK